MARFRKKPVVIEAFQLGIDYIPDWFMDKVTTNDIILHGTSSGFEHHDDINADIKTLEGWHHANFGDFIIKGTAGEIYPCKPHIFKDIYESADTTADVAEVIHAYWKTVTEIKDNTVCGDGRQIQYKICSNCEQPMGVCGNDYCGHCGARMDGPEIFTPEYMQSLFQEARERLERIKNSPGDCFGLSFKQLDYELMDDRFKSNSEKKCTEGEE